MPEQISIAQYLLQRLYEKGVKHIFGVPGDYILGFYDRMVKSPVQHIGTTREDTAAFAADGYARSHGLGALAVTYGVGALSVVNAVAGANAESSPVVVISGAPGLKEQKEQTPLHHRFGDYHFQKEIFERITCATTVLDDPFTALREIDRTLEAAQHHSAPVYIEIPRDMVDVPGFFIPPQQQEEMISDAANLSEAINETIALFGAAKIPVVLAGVETHRRGLQDELAQLVTRSRLPIAATLTGKSVVGERHPAYLGIYEGAMGSPYAREYVEQADFVLMLGVTFNDVDLGIDTAKLDPSCIVRAAHNEVHIRYHRYHNIALADFTQALLKAIPARQTPWPNHRGLEPLVDFPLTDQPMTVSRLIARLNHCLTPDMTVVADTGDCLFAAIELRVHERSGFLASAFYTTMGFAMPAALGAQIAQPQRRPLVLVGDGAFQMTGTELSTMARLALNPIIIVFNNRGYSTERFILDGPFNDIAEWRFDQLGAVFGPLHGYDVHSEEQFESALQSALASQDAPSLLNVHLSPDDPSPAMKRLGESLHKRI